MNFFKSRVFHFFPNNIGIILKVKSKKFSEVFMDYERFVGKNIKGFRNIGYLKLLTYKGLNNKIGIVFIVPLFNRKSEMIKNRSLGI